MLVGDISEFELIADLESTIDERNRKQIDGLRSHGVVLELGIGDDAAAWHYPASTVVATTDTMVEGVHFLRDSTPWRELGWKAVASNLSDVGAMGCRPTFALVTLGLGPSVPVEGLREMYRGMMDVLEYAGGALVGGDIVRSDTLFVAVSVDGIAEGSASVLTRSAARPGDAVAVTGFLGSSGGGLRLIEQADIGLDVEEEARKHLVAAHNRPTPRVREGCMLRRLGVRCAMDISDGLATDLGKMCEASGVSAQIEAEAIPVEEELRASFPEDWLDLALTGGEDYELVFTADDATMAVASSQLGGAVSVIGRIEEGEGSIKFVDKSGTRLRIGRGGWDHFGA